MGGKVDDKGFLRLPWPVLSVLWSIAAGLIVFGYNTMQTSGELQSTVAGMRSDVSGLARGVNNMERRLELDAQSRYTVGDAAKDFALVNAQLAEHERRMQRIEGKR